MTELRSVVGDSSLEFCKFTIVKHQQWHKLRFNGYEQQNNEFNDGSGIEWYDYKNRFYDNQIGRFFVQDRLADEYVYYSPYQFAGNEVPKAIDLDGLEPHPMTSGINWSTADLAQKAMMGDESAKRSLSSIVDASGKIAITTFTVASCLVSPASLSIRGLLISGAIGAGVNVTFSILAGESGNNVLKSAISGFVGGSVLRALGGYNSITATLSSGYASSAAANAVDQAISSFYGDRDKFDFDEMVMYGGIGVLSNVVSNAVVNSVNGFIDQRLAQDIAGTETPAYRKTIKNAIKEESPNIGTRSLSKAINQRIKEAQGLLKKQAELAKVAVKQATERLADYLQNETNK